MSHVWFSNVDCTSVDIVSIRSDDSGRIAYLIGTSVRKAFSVRKVVRQLPSVSRRLSTASLVCPTSRLEVSAVFLGRVWILVEYVQVRVSLRPGHPMEIQDLHVPQIPRCFDFPVNLVRYRCTCNYLRYRPWSLRLLPKLCCLTKILQSRSSALAPGFSEILRPWWFQLFFPQATISCMPCFLRKNQGIHLFENATQIYLCSEM